MSNNPPDPQKARYAWRDIPATPSPKRNASARAADFLEIYGPYDEASAREQASRCIQCPNPTCVQGCPLCNPIPEWMQLTAEGKFLEAAAVIGSATNLPEICSRLCPSDHLCEGRCILDSVSEPVPIRCLEQFVLDYAFAKGEVNAAAAPPNGLSVAVIGSGAAGLTCADELSRRGYAVTVLDSGVVPGGLLVHGTPAFDLDGTVIQRRLDLLKQRGVRFETNVPLWKEVTLATLLKQHDAIVLALDGREARPLTIPGAQLPGVVQAIAFLLQKNTAVPLTGPGVDVAGKNVVVIGAGDTAIECARSAVRYNAASVICAYRRGEAEMPCSRARYQAAVEEGVKFVFHVTPLEVLGTAESGVRALSFAKTDPTGSAGGEDKLELPADCVIPALGFVPGGFENASELQDLEHTPNGALKVDPRHQTSLQRVFAAGDLVQGVSPLLETVRDARLAAEGMDQALQASRRAA